MVCLTFDVILKDICFSSSKINKNNERDLLNKKRKVGDYEIKMCPTLTTFEIPHAITDVYDRDEPNTEAPLSLAKALRVSVMSNTRSL